MKTWRLDCGCRVSESAIVEWCGPCRAEHDALHTRALADYRKLPMSRPVPVDTMAAIDIDPLLR